MVKHAADLASLTLPVGCSESSFQWPGSLLWTNWYTPVPTDFPSKSVFFFFLNSNGYVLNSLILAYFGVSESETEAQFGHYFIFK